MDPSHFILSPVEEHMGCFHFLVTMNSAVVNIRSNFLCGFVFSFLLGLHAGVEFWVLWKLYVSQVEKLLNFLKWPHHLKNLPAMCEGSSFS